MPELYSHVAAVIFLVLLAGIYICICIWTNGWALVLLPGLIVWALTGWFWWFLIITISPFVFGIIISCFGNKVG